MTAAELIPSRGALAVWYRHLLVWRQLFWPSMASNVFEPLLFLFAFGFGLGAIVGELGELPYLVFIVPGVMAYTAMFSASFESTISAYARFQMQRTWDAQLATPLSLTDVLTGELLWATSKALIASSCVFAVGWLWGGIPSLAGALIGLPILGLAAVCFGAVGLCATAFAKNWDFYNYFFTFWVTPMFIFSGVFFEVSRFPDAVQWLAWVLPMTHLVAVLRPLTVGAGLDVLPAVGHLIYLAAMACVAFAAARWRAGERMFD